MRAVKRPVVLITVVAALVAATVYGWSDVRQARAFRRLIAEGDAALGRGETLGRHRGLQRCRGAAAAVDAPLPQTRRHLSPARASSIRPSATSPRPRRSTPRRRSRSNSRATCGWPGATPRARWRRIAPIWRSTTGRRALQYKLGLALYRSGDLAGAADAARRALALDANARRGAPTARPRGAGPGPDRRGRGRRLTRAIELQPASDATRSTLADLYAAQGRTRDETAQREAVAALDAARPDGLVSLALAQARHGRSDAAVATLSAGRRTLSRLAGRGQRHRARVAGSGRDAPATRTRSSRRSRCSRRPPRARTPRARRSRSTAARCC